METERKEYEKPQVIYREQMEAMAGACAINVGKQSQVDCAGLPFNS